MKHYLVLTDTNSRQYPIQINDDGLELSNSGSYFILNKDKSNFSDLFNIYGKTLVGKNTIIDFDNIVAIQFQEIPEEV